MSSAEEIKAEYMSSLADLTFNSRPLINVLKMLAEENAPHAAVIVEAIEEHLSKVNTDVKLPILYLIDCIVKTVGGIYTSLFNHNIVNMFIGVFKGVDEKTRSEMFKLRQTWNEVFPQMKLYAIDVQINLLDPAWPVTAKPPSNSIHLNPRFLKNTSPSSTPKVKTEPGLLLMKSEPEIAPTDPQGRLLQEQLIQKQRELLELQQKKLELEVLQTQVKLREQYHSNQPQNVRPHNILLKPEVAKQLVPSLAQHKQTLATASLVQQQLNQSQAAPTNGTKINPVSSALINAKPIRDPRLLRQQQKKDQSAPSDGNPENQLQRTALLETNKIVSNKNSVRKHRNDPRLVNKDDTSIQRSDSSKPNHPSKSRSSESAHHKSHKTSRSSSQRGPDASSPKSSSNSVSIELPKAKSDSVKPVKNRKKEKSEKRPLNLDKPSKVDSSAGNNTAFKNVTESMKNRNYVRKKVGSVSPDAPKDEDLRSFGPPEKQIRLDGDSNDKTLKVSEPCPSVVSTSVPTSLPAVPTVAKDLDVDLRQLPAMVTKKRSSTETQEGVIPAKKNKMEIFDKLFGDEDTDLRPQLAINTEQRPKTPPPPIISVAATETKTSSPKTDSPKSNFDAVRAKLANATNRDKVLAKSYKKKPKLEDQDLRQQTPAGANKTKIIISPEDKTNIMSGKMTNEEGSELLNKIILQVEKRKLKEAKRKEHEQSFGVSPEPISDDDGSDTELKKETTKADEPIDGAKSHENKPEHQPISEESLIPFNDKDERLNPGPPPPQSDFGGHFFPRDGRDARRFPGPHWRGRGGRRWEPQQPMMPVRPWNANSWAPREEFAPSPEEVEHIYPNGHVNADEVKSITIDSVSRDIRFYGETAIVFIGWDDPRELTFQNAGVRKITFNDMESFVLNFNDDYKEVYSNGNPHIVRIGAPSREIFIDKVPYECFFGSPGIRTELDGVPTKVHLEGPPPPVSIGKVKRTDLVAGKIKMFVDAVHVVPVFLDAKVQTFVLDGQTSTLKFVDALKTVLINDVPFKIEYGGLPKPLFIHGKKHFVRFSVLPRGIRPGKVKLVDMDVTEPSKIVDENSQDGQPATDAYDPALPISGMMEKPGSDSPDRNSNSPNSALKFIQQNNLDVLSNALSLNISPVQASGGYQIENQNSQDSQASSQPITTLPPVINIHEIFQNLVASGLVKSSAEPIKPVEEPPKVVEPPKNETTKVPAANTVTALPPKPKKSSVLHLKPITFSRPETLRIRQNNLYSMLYSGMQCSTCGMRFSPEASMLYSQHLDWHFRQNRRGKRNSRIATSRRWYYSLADWKNYEELEDLEEREKNFFDEQKQAEGSNEDADEEVEIPSVAADPESTDECCVVCREKFDQFFNEEKEEWHLRNAIRIDDKTYHPICYEDFQNSLLEQTLDESVKVSEEIEKPPEENTEKIIPGLEIIIDDDDDDIAEEVEPTTNEILSVESDDSKLVSETTETPEPEQQKADADGEDDDDDDVILNEVAPIKIVVDDDDDETTVEQTRVSPPPVVEADDDGFVEIAGLVSLPNGKHVKIKAEPVDKEDLTITPDEDLPTPTLETPEVEVIEQKNSQQNVSSLDGNMEPSSSVNPIASSALGGNRIKINISKPLPVINKEKETTLGNDLVPSETYIDPFEPFPPGEEPQPTSLKPLLKSTRLSKLPPVKKGTELTGLCSIM